MIVAGARNDSGIGQDDSDAVAVGYDAATGERRWVAVYDGGGYDIATALAIAPDGSRFYFGGLTRGPQGPSDIDFLTAGFDTADGALLWSAQEGSQNVGQGSDRVQALAVSPDGSTVAATGWWEVPGSPTETLAYGTVAYEAADEDRLGERRWLRTFGRGGAWEVAFSPDSSLVHVAGDDLRPNTGVLDIGVVTYRAETGAQAWTDRYDQCVQSCLTRSMAVHPVSGDLYVAGEGLTSRPTGAVAHDSDFVVLGYRGSGGERLWTTRYDSLLAHQLLPAIDVSPDGTKLVFAGVTQVRGQSMLTTVGLDPDDGSLLWDARYGVPGEASFIDPSSPFIAVTSDRAFVMKTMIHNAGPAAARDLFVATYEI